MVSSNTQAIRIRRQQLLIVLNLVSASLNCRSEDVRILTVVVSKLKFSDIQMQIFLADLVIGSDNAALEDRPEAFNRVGVNCANDVLANCMIDKLMREAAVQPLIAGISVCAEKANAVRYSLPHESLKREPVCAFDHAGDDIALALDCAHNGSLAGVSAPALSALFVPMPVFIATADVGFIDLNNSAEFLDVLDHRGSDLVAHKPSSFVAAEAHVAENLEGTHALFADQHKVRDSVPIFQRLIRVLKDCAGQVRETVALVCAGIALPMESHCGDGIDALGIATRASDAFGPPASDQISNAIFLSLKQRIELRCGQLVDWLGMLAAGHDGLLFDRKETLA
jgi:hypothetical protein